MRRPQQLKNSTEALALGLAGSSPLLDGALPADTVSAQGTRTIHFGGLVRLRWGALCGQAVTIAAVQLGLGIELPLFALLPLLGCEALSNLVAFLLVQRRGIEPPPLAAPSLMILDTGILTALLFWTGGPMNPFSFLYLVQIALASVMLPPRWTWALVLLSVAGSALLFLSHHPLEMGTLRHDHMRMHLLGMWIAFVVAAAFIVYFLRRVTAALNRRERELEEARQLNARQERLASVATLAAGAAHELSTPLATIGLVATELERELLHHPGEALNDVRLIASQVERCRSILDRMSHRCSERSKELASSVDLRRLVAEVGEELGQEGRIETRLAEGVDVLHLGIQGAALAECLRNLVKNALEASKAAVAIEVTREQGGVRIDVADRGTGIDPRLRGRLGEPFLTTKASGEGMGLGVFVARSVLEGVGGQLSYESRSGGGTLARVLLPVVSEPGVVA